MQPALAVPIGIGVVYLPLGHGALDAPPRQQLAEGTGKCQRGVDAECQSRAGQRLHQRHLVLQRRTQQGIQIRRHPGAQSKQRGDPEPVQLLRAALPAHHGHRLGIALPAPYIPTDADRIHVFRCHAPVTFAHY
ncbi:hypothetical protein D3C72_1659530 [compost metagenome]